MERNIEITVTELQVVAELDSRQFGFLKLNDEANASKKNGATKAIQYLERVLVQANLQDKKKKNGEERHRGGFHVEPKTFVKLGHLHLLLGNYSKALSAYQKYYRISKHPWRDSTCMYGLGLVYFHYNAFQWATKAFQITLYIDPGFARANEIHMRLGIIRKMKNDFDGSLKHFALAKTDSSESTFTPLEIEFHIAHLYEVCGKYIESKQRYDVLLSDPGLPLQLRADILRQIGWMFHSVDDFGDKTQRVEQAVFHLQKSIEADPKSGQSLYLLGRCYASIGKVHDAFIAYRNSVDKSESNADTWCSIGVLYQQQSQPMDALQAYICAVQLDKDHSAAWTNLGILYESQSQPQDALACYTNATRNKPSVPTLAQRIKYLKTQMASAPSPVSTSKSRQLPSVEEAWNLPISNEMTNRQNQPRQGIRPGQTVKKEDGAPPPPAPAVQQQPQPQQRPHFYLTPQQLQTLQFLQNQPHLTPQQQNVLQQLQHQFRLMQQHQQQMRLQAQQQQVVGMPRPVQPQGQFQQQQQPQQAQQGAGNTNTEIDGLNVSDKELESLLSQQDIGSFAESLLKQFQAQIGDSDDKGDSDGIKSETKPDPNDILSEIAKSENLEDSLKHELMDLDHLDIPTTIEKVVHDTYNIPEINIKMSAEEIVEACAKCPAKAGRISSSVFDEDDPPPSPPDRPPNNRLVKEELLPPTPSVYLENKKDACSPQLQEFCLQHPITVVRGIAAALKMDLGLYSTKQLVESQPEHPMHLVTQYRQTSDENFDASGQNQVWHCYGEESVTTISAYAKYQVSSFQEAFAQEQDKSGSRSEEEMTNRKKKKGMATLKHGDHIDLSAEHKFRQQLQELMKLPPWTKVVSAGNILSHAGHQLLGMNTVKMSMKVPNARTTARQEHNNFCVVNINIGPGDCEWFGIPEDYWGAMYELCDKNGVNYLTGSWWPSMKDLMDAEIPVYRFLQKPGDLVWVNSGCIHWMQASSWSNNIEWNVGPMTYKQYTLSLHRYEWNKLQQYKSKVAMIFLSWNMAKNVRITEPKLFEAVKHTLMRTLRQVILTLDYLKSRGVEVKFHGRNRNEPAHYCTQCEIEVFGVLFVRQQEKKHVIYCLDCARRHNHELKGFVILEEYHLKELKDVYNNFKLASQNPLPTMGGIARPYHHQSSLNHSSSVGAGVSSHPHSQVAPLSRSISTPVTTHSSMTHNMASNMATSMMSSLGQMTPQQQQLVLQQALQQQAMLNP